MIAYGLPADNQFANKLNEIRVSAKCIRHNQSKLYNVISKIVINMDKSIILWCIIKRSISSTKYCFK